MNIRLIIFFIWIFQMGGYAQLSSAFSEYKQRELWKNNSNEKTLLTPQYVFTETAASTWFDVTYYRLELKVLTQPNFLKGKVTITGICRTGNALTLTFDLMDNMSVDSVLVNSQARSFIKQSNSFVISLSHPSTSGEVLSIDIFYEGLPVPTGFGSFIFGSHNSIPWVYSLSEPYGAKDWWPCKDDPSDKADSADIIITCDSTLKVGSQGILVSVTDNGDGTATHYWKERYPIASYLISVAITNYVQFSNWFRYSDTDSMEILNYVLPEHYSDALQNLPHVVDMLEIYSGLLGMYPFIEEKYGHAEFSGGGAMEHQTMTSTVTFNEDVISHELAHQWFGDMITCQTWADLWLNEGFAEYCSALYRERQYGISSYWAYMNIRFDQAKLANGVIGIPDLSNVRSLFNPNRMYSKGASVLHMLRHVLGDSTFFRSIYAYANNPALKYSTATIGDFQSVCETVAGKDLSYFFQEWIYGEGFPKYNYSWTWNLSDDISAVILSIEQPIGKSVPPFYTMPIDIRITAENTDTTVTVWNNAQQQTFMIPCSGKPSAILLDPEGWILKSVFFENTILPLEYKLEQNYPNPFNSGTTIAYRLPRRERVILKVYDILGREITTLVNAKQSAGFYKYQWNPQNNASGIYFYRLITESTQLQNKMVLLK